MRAAHHACSMPCAAAARLSSGTLTTASPVAGLEERQLPAVAQRLPRHGDGHPAVDLVGRAADDVGHHADPLLQVDQGHTVRLAPGEGRTRRLGLVLHPGRVAPWPARWRCATRAPTPGAAQCGQNARG